MKTQRFPYWVLTMLLLCSTMLTAYAEIDLTKFKVNTKPVKDSQTMVQQSDLIVLGWPENTEKKYPTNETIGHYKIFNVLQTIRTQKVLKGSPPSQVNIVTPGVDPLPNPTNPLNKTYPGPLAKENYVLFLKKLPHSEYYTMIGGWQGVYPLIEGKTVSFEGLGFQELNGLSVDQLEQRVKGWTGS